MSESVNKKPHIGPITLITALVLYGIAAVLAVYIGTIAMMPQGAILGLILFVLATYALSVFFRRPRHGDSDADEEL